jgi:spore maturation protein CgeB
MRTFMLSDLVPKALEGGMVKYDSFDDLLVKIDYYLEHEAERKAIAEKGKELVKPYTYEKRLEEMIEVIENARLG